jgi:type IV secretion system protein VirB9
MLGKLLPASLVLLVLGGTGLAEESPRPVRQDSRIRTVTFQLDNVVMIDGALGVSTMIMFGDDEHIDTVAIGDSVGWQAVPNQSKRFLFIKPLEPDATTNLNVVTTERVYNFILRTVSNRAAVVYKVRFVFPEQEEDKRLMTLAKARAAMPNYKEVMASPSTNFDYSYKGNEVVKPEYVFDDGVKTFFRFAGDVPGIFVVNPDRSETLANYRREGDVIVVDSVSAQWTMRNGGDTACVFNMRGLPVAPKRTVAADVQPELQTLHAAANTR